MNLGYKIDWWIKNVKLPQIIISDEIRKVAPNLVIWAIYADVDVEKNNEKLWLMLNDLWNNIKIKVDEIVEQPNISSTRDAYLKCWKQPSKYRWSAESLLRRLAQWKWLYQINTVVDINNYLSLKSLIPIGSYDLSNIEGDITIGIWKSWESYKWIWKDIINIEKLPVFSDNKWPFGSPTSDSERAMINLNSKKILIMMISFWWNQNWDIKNFLNDWEKLLKEFVNWKNIEIKIY